MPTYAIVGAGVAGASAAEALRGAGFDGRIVLIGEEAEAPYQRPPLSKEILRGEVADDFPRLRTSDFYRDKNIDLRLGERVVRIDTGEGRLTCASGATVDYDKLLIAAGGSPRRLTVPGGDLPGVHYLRTFADARALREQLATRPPVLVVGGGFIGCEVAASARLLGCEVSVVGPTLPMEHVLGPEIGAAFAGYHRGHGVRVLDGATVTAFEGAGRLERALLGDVGGRSTARSP